MLLLLILFLLFFLIHRFETMRVPGQRLDDSLLVLGCVLLVVAAVVAVAVLVTEYLLLETFAVQLQAFRPFAVAPKLALTHHVVIFLVNWGQYARIAAFTALRKGLRWITNGILYGKTFVDSFLEGFSKRLRIERVLSLEHLSVLLRVLAWAFVFHLWRDQTLVRAGTVENLPKVFCLY